MAFHARPKGPRLKLRPKGTKKNDREQPEVQLPQQAPAGTEELAPAGPEDLWPETPRG